MFPINLTTHATLCNTLYIYLPYHDLQLIILPPPDQFKYPRQDYFYS